MNLLNKITTDIPEIWKISLALFTVIVCLVLVASGVNLYVRLGRRTKDEQRKN